MTNETLGGINRFDSVRVKNLTVTGTLTASSTETIAGATTITAASANALAVGANGTTNPAFNVATNSASAATGISITSAAAASGVAVVVTSSGTDENLTINAKGSGTVTVNGTATGGITLGRAVTLSSTLTGGSTSDIAINTNKFTVAASSGNTVVAGTLGVTGVTTNADNVVFSAAAKTIVLKQGANGKTGTFIANGATPVSVATTAVTANSGIIFTLKTVGGTVGAYPAIQTITASTGFTVACTASDTSTYNFHIIESAA